MEHVTRFVCDVIKKHAPIVYFIKGGEHVFVLNLRHSVSIPRDLGPWTKHGKCSQWTESFHKRSPLIIASKLWSMVIIIHSNHHASYNMYTKNVYVIIYDHLDTFFVLDLCSWYLIVENRMRRLWYMWEILAKSRKGEKRILSICFSAAEV